ncbi:hypothetical protein AMS68_007038 [Peltaster fructicola]|uniref:Aquaporin n=1 Tax=Peltaster fructicola TaxID=286661 RepID=A0A6H0Y3M8_9PEZI|nr:hypothetical protein AMS68_007038 [Peltaster fructicola]
MNFDRITGDGGFNLPFIKPRPRVPGKRELHVPVVGYLPNRVRNHFVAMVGEFVGTFMFLFFAFSGTSVANAASSGGGGENGSLSNLPNASSLMYISLAFGFSLAVNAWIFFRISGGLFNPAVTLALGMIGAITWVRAAGVFVAQMLGAMASAAVVEALFPGQLNVAVTLGGNTSTAQGLFIEMFLTAELVFTICMLAAEKHKGTFLAPVGIGLALFIAELSGVYYTGGALNPARAFGPCVAIRNFPNYHWIYWLGPALGTVLAVTFYLFVKRLEYQTANPGQDFNEKEAENFTFDEENAVTAADVARPAEDLQLNQIPDTAGEERRSRSPVGRGTGGSPVRPNFHDIEAYQHGPNAEAQRMPSIDPALKSD